MREKKILSTNSSINIVRSGKQENIFTRGFFTFLQIKISDNKYNYKS